jgi:transposase-like protein
MASADRSTVRAEYIAGGISLRDLAEKYNINPQTVMSWAHREKWEEQRQAVASKVQARRNQKIAETVATAEIDNATIAANIKRDILLLIQRTIDGYPTDATEIKKQENGEQRTYKLKDLADAYKTMTSDMIPQADESELRRIKEILGTVESVIE